MEKYEALKNQRTNLRNAIPLDTPFALFIDPTNWCNFKCSFCPRNRQDFSHYAGAFQHMKVSLFEKIVADLGEFSDQLKVLRLFYLGEPFLCPDFFSMLGLAVEKNIAARIEISSNASLLSSDKIERLLNIASRYEGSLYLRFSIYSVYADKNQAITKSNVDPVKIYNNIRELQQKRDAYHLKNVCTYAKMMDSFTDENSKFLTWYQPIVDEIQIEKPMNWSGDNDLLTSTYTSEQIASLHKKIIPRVCAYPFHTMAIQSDGAVVCCCVDWQRQTYIGDVSRESLYDIWHGSRLKSLQKLHLLGKREQNFACRGCEHLPCGGSYSADNLDGVNPEILN